VHSRPVLLAFRLGGGIGDVIFGCLRRGSVVGAERPSLPEWRARGW